MDGVSASKHEARNRAHADAVKSDLHMRVGRDISLMLEQVNPASEEMVVEVAVRLNEQMDHIFLDPQSRECGFGFSPTWTMTGLDASRTENLLVRSRAAIMLCMLC